MIKYKIDEKSSNAGEALLNKESRDITFEDENLFKLHELIFEFYEAYKSNEIDKIEMKFKELNGLLNVRGKNFTNLIIRSDFLTFLHEQLNSTLDTRILLIVLDLTQTVLLFSDDSITMILLKNGTLELLNDYISESHNSDVLHKVLNCIGYATFDLYKNSIDPIFDLNSPTMMQILENNEMLYPIYMNLLSNTLFCILDYEKTVEFIKFYISMIDLKRCKRKNISQLFRCIIQRIKQSNKNKLEMDFYYNVFKDTPLSEIICKIFWNDRFDVIVNQQIKDVRFYALKLIIVFLDKDFDDLFYNQIKIIQPLDYYNLIISSNSSFKVVQKTFELLTILISKDDVNFLNDFSQCIFLQTGKSDLFNYEAYKNQFPFNVNVWYLKFLSVVILRCELKYIEIFFSQDFIEYIISHIDQENFDISESALLVINSILKRVVKDNLMFVVDFFMERENPFSELIDSFTDDIDRFKDETKYSEIKKLAYSAIMIMSEANEKYKTKQ